MTKITSISIAFVSTFTSVLIACSKAYSQEIVYVVSDPEWQVIPGSFGGARGQLNSEGDEFINLNSISQSSNIATYETFAIDIATLLRIEVNCQTGEDRMIGRGQVVSSSGDFEHVTIQDLEEGKELAFAYQEHNPPFGLTDYGSSSVMSLVCANLT